MPGWRGPGQRVPEEETPRVAAGQTTQSTPPGKPGRRGPFAPPNGGGPAARLHPPATRPDP
eukprot:14093647-Alexandrium_andersonii.AAC.1